MKRRIATLLLLVLTASCSLAPVDDGSVERRDAPYLVLISIDGFRHDYLDRFPTPALQRVAATGVRAKSLRPVWPTLTFPNHYSIATGLYPAAHGIIANDFMNAARDAWYRYKQRDTVQDGSWYGGEPIWVTAERAGIGSAAFYFVGTEAPVNGIAPADWRAFDASVPGEARVAQALAWLQQPEDVRPHVITLYFEHVDDASHRYGPASAQCVAAIETVDRWIGQLLDGIAALPIAGATSVVIVSDHGQSQYRREVEPLVLSDLMPLDGIDIVESGPVSLLYIKNGDRDIARIVRDIVNQHWQHGTAYLREDAPADWQVANSPRMADVLLQAEPGYAVISHRDKMGKVSVGDHGWAPDFPDMHGIFLASGPGLPRGERFGTIGVVDIYPLLLRQLGLPDARPAKTPSRLLDFLSQSSAMPRATTD